MNSSFPGYAAIVLVAAAGSAQTAAQPDLRGMAAGILEQARSARDAIAGRDLASARQHVRNALQLVQNIRSASPDSRRPLLIRVFTDIETTDTIRPAGGRNASVRDADSDIRRGSLNID